MKIEKSPISFMQKVRKAHILFRAEWELTNRCNENCLHCLRDTGTDNELTAPEIKDILIQLRRENCFNITFTGGELFLRKDIFEILEFAKELGFAISILSNGTCLDEKKVRILKKLKPSFIQISLYGASEQMHDSITQAKGSFEKTINSLRLLKKHKVPFRINTVALNKNFAELKQLKKIAKQNGWKINFDFIVFPCFLGGKAPVSCRVTDEQLRAAFKNRLLKWGRGLAKLKTHKALFDIGYSNWNELHISSNGKAYPSVLLRLEIGDLRKDTLHNIWHNSPRLKWLRSLKKEDFACFHCQWYNNCCWRAEMAFLEERNLRTIPREICRINRIAHSCR